MENLPLFQQYINPQAIEVCRIIHEAGYEAYIVGGCVRDLLLGVKPKDWDITTNANPQTIMQLFPKNYPTGLQHGTVTVAMGEGVENHFEVTTFRIEGEYTDGRRPEEVFFVMNVEEDLARRDLTINAIAYDPLSGRIVDPFGGQEDLQNQIIKAVGTPEARFQEDGLRIMRVARFAARFNYRVDDATWQGMVKSLDTLKKVSKERLRDELCKTLMTTFPSYGLRILLESGALAIVCPYLASKPVFTEFMVDIDKCLAELETKVAFLYGNCTPKETVIKELRDLKFSNNELKKISFLLELLDKYAEVQSVAAYKGFMAALINHSPVPWEEALEQFILLTEAIGLGSRAHLAKYKSVIILPRKEMKINGDDLLLMGIKPGPQIKYILNECYLEILKDPKNNNEAYLLSFAAGVPVSFN